MTAADPAVPAPSPAPLPEEIAAPLREYGEAVGMRAIRVTPESYAREEAARERLVAALSRYVEAAADWEAWALHQEGCPWCAESHPRDCGDGTLLWARCHPEDEEARAIVAERDPRAAVGPDPINEKETPRELDSQGAPEAML